MFYLLIVAEGISGTFAGDGTGYSLTITKHYPVIASIDDVVKLLAPHMQYLKQEEFRVILLDSKKRLIRHQRVSLGSLNASLVEPREVFRPALTTGTHQEILNHLTRISY